MTKHRKILEGVSEGPWGYQDGNIFKGDSPDLVASYFENDADGTFVEYAYEKWPAICDLIDAVDELLENLAYDHKMDFPKVEAALDKLNAE